jgi:hypothetical protein
MLKRYEIVRSVILKDKPNTGKPRFTIVSEGYVEDPDAKYIHFEKGDEYLGADRTETGQFLIRNQYLKEK